MMGTMTTGEIVVMGLFLVLGLNVAVYVLRTLSLLLQNRTAPVLAVFIGFWPRVLSGDLDGLDPESAKQKIGFIPDRPHLYEKLTGMEFLKFTADLYGVREEHFRKKGRDVLEMFSLLHWSHELIESYSHGMKQRLIMAAALFHEPEVIIVDEPMVGLDPAGIKMVKDLFKRLSEKGITVFISTHTLSVAEDVCRRIGIIFKGNLITTGTLAGLRQKTRLLDAGLEDVFIKLTSTNPILSEAHTQ